MKHLYYAIFLGLLMVSCGGNKQEKKQSVKPIKYEIIGNNSSATIKKFNGVSQSGTEAKLSFRANGLITTLNAKIGDKVKKGELLAKLDQKDIVLGYEKAKAAVASAKSQMETAKSSLERVKELYQINSASLSDYEQAKNSYANAQANYETSLKSVDIQESQFEYTQIVAPFSGIITDVNADVNEFAQAGSPVFTMSSEGNDLEIKVGVPESYISSINNGESVHVTISNQTLEGVVSEVGYSTSGAVTYPVVVKLVNPSERLRPGMPAVVSFKISSGERIINDEIIAPVKSIGNDTEGEFVFLLVKQDDGNYLVKRQNVVLGELTDYGFIIVEGLSTGDLVATAGLRTMYDGMVVKLINP
ncbi:efflux RND transporter periplasmic adaptor subunit [uncultured Draconibacterium sp.]|uniref:efflux RND transporter periplasmic adaptor subunit n=1 Tax=uncultured Draconibacterium sp. TaxID=1573823 RepID=UPI0029C80EDD|nr:efflux RND transporter periplasmic adaptor subunit [uncultured Draconibacterium sp.]